MKFESTFRVGLRKCHMVLNDQSISCEWTPSVPNKLSRPEIDEYLAGRNFILAEVAKVRGNIAVVTTI